MTSFCAAADTIAVKALDWSVPQACREPAGCPFEVVGALQQNDPLLCVGIGAAGAVPRAVVPPFEGATAGVPVVPLGELGVVAAPLLADVVVPCGVALGLVVAPLVGTGWQDEPFASGLSSTTSPGGQACTPAFSSSVAGCTVEPFAVFWSDTPWLRRCDPSFLLAVPPFDEGVFADWPFWPLEGSTSSL